MIIIYSKGLFIYLFVFYFWHQPPFNIFVYNLSFLTAS